MTSDMRIISFALFFFWLSTQQSEAQTTSSKPASEGDTVTFVCSLSGTFTFPEWRGPPSLLKYTNQDDASGTINSNAPAAGRLQYASNNRDLILSSALINDSGDYQCSYTGLGDHTITVTVTESTTTSTTSSTSIATNNTNMSHAATSTQPSTTTTTKSTDKFPDNHTIIIISVIVAVVVAGIMVIICFCMRKKREKVKKMKRENNKKEHETVDNAATKQAAEARL